MTIESIAILGFVIFVGAVLGSITYDKLKEKAAKEKAIKDAFIKKREELLKSAPPKPLPYSSRTRQTVNPFGSSTTTTTTTIKRGTGSKVTTKSSVGKATNGDIDDAHVQVEDLLKMIEELKKNI